MTLGSICRLAFCQKQTDGRPSAGDRTQRAPWLPPDSRSATGLLPVSRFAGGLLPAGAFLRDYFPPDVLLEGLLPARRLYFHLTIEKLFGGRRATLEGPVCQVLASPLAGEAGSRRSRSRVRGQAHRARRACPSISGGTCFGGPAWRDRWSGPLLASPPGGRGVLDCCFRRNDIQGGRLVPQTSRLPFLPLPWGESPAAAKPKPPRFSSPEESILF